MGKGKRFFRISLTVSVAIMYMACGGGGSSHHRSGKPPETTILSSPDNPTNQSAAVFEFGCNEEDCTFECAIDSSGYSACSSPSTFSGLASGAHLFQVRAKDIYGNVDQSPASYSWVIDTTSPLISITATPVNPTNSVSATFEFTCDESNCSYECSLDSRKWEACAPPVIYTHLAEGSHLFSVRGKDLAGNDSATTSSYSWVVDTTPPATTITGYPVNPTNQVLASMAFTCGEPGCTYECRFDSGVWTSCSPVALYGPLADGTHYFEVRAVDTAGNMDPSPASYSWEVDTKAPQTLITTKPFDPSNSATALFEFSCDESLCTFECQLDAGVFSSCGSPKNYASLTDGLHTFTVRATDEAGNINPSSPASYSWTIDTAAPDSILSSTPNNPTRDTDAAFAFNCTGGPCTYECKLDSGSWSSCTSPRNLTGLLEGIHLFQVRAIDAAHNVDASPAAYTWEIDLTPPITSLTSKPSDPSNSDSPEFSFGCSETGCAFQCNLDSAGWTACTSPQTYTGLSEGGHSFQVRAVDAAGNAETSPPSYAWTIDTTAPDTSLTKAPANPANLSSANFAFNGSEANCTFECQLDSGSWAACISPAAYTGLSEGNHTFKVRARDPAGNMDASPASFAWTVDLTPPTVFISSHPANPTNSQTASFAFFCSETGCTFECRMDGGVWSGCSSPQTYSSLGEGQHIFQARATDAAGNCSNPATFIWIVNTVPPVTTITSAPTDPSQSATATFSFACNNGPCTFQCQLDGGGYSSCVSPKTYTGLSETTHTFQVFATDAAGNVEPTPAVYQWTVLLFVDTTISYGPSNPTQSQAASFGFSCNKPSCNFECSLDSSPFSACVSPQSYSGLAEGAHNFQVRAWYLGTPDLTPASYTWVIDRTPPHTTILSGPSNPSSSPTATFTFSCNETGCTFECKLDSGSWSACSSPKAYTGLAIGSHTFQVRATDAAGNLETSPPSYTWNISSFQGWTPTSTTNAPSGRSNHTAVWTGSEMIIWGGESSSYMNTGGRYNPSTDSWLPTSITNVPTARRTHRAVWTGNIMIIWGGFSGSYPLDGGRYNPATDSWTPVSQSNQPTGRDNHAAVWTGAEMIVWGGDPYSNTGGKYNPSTNSWTPTSTGGNTPSARSNCSFVWTDTEMIVWGGNSPSSLNTGGRYNPNTDSWQATSTTNAPAARYYHTAVWTGSEMIIWGGSSSTNTGGRYNPATNSWVSTSLSGAPAARYHHTAVWTGNVMIVWGGSSLNTGGQYDPLTDSWTATPTTNAPQARSLHTAVWTGTQMIVWGGSSLNTGGVYNP